MSAQPSQVPDPPSWSTRVRQQLAGALELGKGLGFGFDLPERFVSFWKRLGFTNALIVVLAITIPVAKYEWVPYMASSAVEAFATSNGITLEAGDWTGSLWDLQATAEDVRIRTHGRYAQDTLLEARTVTVDLSLWQRLREGSWVESIELNEPSLYLERLTSGRWNWEDVISRDSITPAPRRDPMPPSDGHDVRIVLVSDLKTRDETEGFVIPRLRMNRLRVQWVENLPGQSGGGLIHSSRAILHFDDVDVMFENLSGPLDERDAPTRMTIEGRTADGRLSIDGTANFFHWGSPQSMGYQMIGGREESVTWSPRLSARIYLENVGTAALAQMVPSTSLRATAGAMTGFIDIALRDRRVACTSDLTLQNVRYEANPLVPAMRGRFEDIQEELDDFRASGRVKVGCEGDLRDPFYRPFDVLQTGVTREAVRSGPPLVQQVATADHQKASTGKIVDESVSALTDQLAGKAGRLAAGLVGQQAGESISSSLSGAARGKSSDSTAANPVTRGAKGVGSAVKRLFGGGRKKTN